MTQLTALLWALMSIAGLVTIAMSPIAWLLHMPWLSGYPMAVWVGAGFAFCIAAVICGDPYRR